MNYSTSGIITKIVIAVPARSHDKDTVTITSQFGLDLTINKLTKIGDTNIYELSCKIVNTDPIYWQTDLILVYNFPSVISLNEDDCEHNDVNYVVENYCHPSPGERTFSELLYGHSSAVTIFMTDL